MSDELRVTIADARAEGFCVFGVRRWTKTHGIDFENFLRNGLSVADLRAQCPDNAFVERVIAAAEERHGRE